MSGSAQGVLRRPLATRTLLTAPDGRDCEHRTGREHLDGDAVGARDSDTDRAGGVFVLPEVFDLAYCGNPLLPQPTARSRRGPAGVGQTRLAREMFAYWQSQGRCC